MPAPRCDANGCTALEEGMEGEEEGGDRRCLRRRLETEARVHKRRKGAKGKVQEWRQRPLSVSRVMQVFSDQSVRERLLREEASIPYLQRNHYLLQSKGFATAHICEQCEEEKPPPESIMTKMEEGLEHA